MSGELFTSTGEIVGRWKEYFEDPSDMHSTAETELEDLEVGSLISGAEVAEAVKQLHGSNAPGVDEICPEFLKTLDVVGLSWLTHLCKIVLTLGIVPLVWQTRVVVPIFKKGDQRVCSNYIGITLLNLPRKIYARVLERKV